MATNVEKKGRVFRNGQVLAMEWAPLEKPIGNKLK
jgi:hypothetical protein